MIRWTIGAALALGLSATAAMAAPKMAHGGPEQGSHMVPAYQVRGAPPPGDRLKPGRDGAQLFRNRCGACHLEGGFGTNVLAARFGRAHVNAPPLLTARKDLTADYVKQVVRQGKVAMPPLSRVEVTEAELDSIAAFLSGKKKK